MFLSSENLLKKQIPLSKMKTVFGVKAVSAIAVAAERQRSSNRVLVRKLHI